MLVFPKPLFCVLVFFSLLTLNACKSSEDTNDEEVSVGRPAKEILATEGTLHVLSLREFTINTLADDDVMVLNMDNFAPSQTDIEPEDDEDQTLNDVKYSRDNWADASISWVTNGNPLLELPYNQTRPYRVLEDGKFIPSPEGHLNKPVFETIDDNIFERH